MCGLKRGSVGVGWLARETPRCHPTVQSGRFHLLTLMPPAIRPVQLPAPALTACPPSHRASADVRRQVWQAGCSYFSGYTTKKPSSGSSANGSASLKAESSVTVGRQSFQGQPWD